MNNDRKTYDVMPSGDGWQVKARTNQRATSRHDTKSEAQASAIERARRHEGDSQVVIHGRDGTIQSERTYGHDPFPPRG